MSDVTLPATPRTSAPRLPFPDRRSPRPSLHSRSAAPPPVATAGLCATARGLAPRRWRQHDAANALFLALVCDVPRLDARAFAETLAAFADAVVATTGHTRPTPAWRTRPRAQQFLTVVSHEATRPGTPELAAWVLGFADDLETTVVAGPTP